MREPARRREIINQGIVHRPHPHFAGKDILFWRHGTLNGSATIEGGDITNTDNGVLIISASGHTTVWGIERLAQRLFGRGAVYEVIVSQIAKKCAQMHLNMIPTVLGEGVFTTCVGLDRVRTQSIRPGARRDLDIIVHETEETESVTTSVLGPSEIHILIIPADSLTAEREQQNNSSGLLVLEPGIVIAYGHNTASDDYFVPQGFEILTIPGNELSHGRGGAYCTTYPIIHDTVSTLRL